MGRKRTRTIYLIDADGEAVRQRIPEEMCLRIKKWENYVQQLRLRKDENVIVELALKHLIVRIHQDLIDLGFYTYDGWYSICSELALESFDQLPEVYFSNRFLRHLFKDAKRECKKVLLQKHKELLVWKRIANEVP